MTTRLEDDEPGASDATPAPSALIGIARGIVANNWMVVVYAILIALCVIYAPSKTIEFIYAEF